jgi:hypothetical protein
MDSVHQGDRDGVKGVYHINAVDCVTQWELSLLLLLEKISEAFFAPGVQGSAAKVFLRDPGVPFGLAFEYIDSRVCLSLLKEMRIRFIRAFWRRRPSRNEKRRGTLGSAGYFYIPQHLAKEAKGLF